jgi:hypothetical protein
MTLIPELEQSIREVDRVLTAVEYPRPAVGSREEIGCRVRCPRFTQSTDELRDAGGSYPQRLLGG